MWARSSDSQENSIDWTYDEVPAADEPSVLGGQRPPGQGDSGCLFWPPRQRASRAWLVIGTLAVLAIALNAVWPRLEAWRTRRAIDTIIEQQEQARLAGDQAGLRATFKNPGGVWPDDQVRRLQFGWQPAAFGLPGAQFERQPGTIISYQVLGPELVRADVARTYVLADGSRAAFAMPEYYQYVDRAWQQVPGPPSSTNDLEALNTDRIYVHYNPADANLAASTAADLDALLARACADWSCPPDLSVAVVFGLPDPALAPGSAPVRSLSGSLTFEMLVDGQMRLPDLVVKMPTHDWAGYPADAQTDTAVRRSAAVQALANVADRLAGGAPGVDGSFRPFLYALVVRELARLGVEPAELVALQPTDHIANADQLWSLSTLDSNSQPVLLGALGLLNRLMAGRSMTDEQHLLHALGQAPDAVAWLEVGLGLTHSQARATWSSLLRQP